MEKQALCESNHLLNCTDDMYFSQPGSMAVCGQNYGMPALESVQPSPISPHFYQDPLESPVTPAQDFGTMVDGPKDPGLWPGGNHAKAAPNLWCPPLQVEAMEMREISNDRGYQYNTLAHVDSEGAGKHPGDSLPRLDSFNQVFASHNLRILQGGKGPQSPGRMLASSPLCAPTDAALRQLLSQKTPLQPTEPPHRYPPVEPQPSRGYDQGHVKAMPGPQQQTHYGYQQQLPQQDQYYLQQQAMQPQPQPEMVACGRSLQQFHMHQQLEHQPGSYYSTHVTTQQPVQTPSFLTSYGQNCKIQQQQQQQQQQFMSSDPGHSIQQAQMFFQEQQKHRQLYHQNNLYLPQPQQNPIQEEIHPAPSDTSRPLPNPGQHTPTHPAHSFMYPREHGLACQEHTAPLGPTTSPLPQGPGSEREVLSIIHRTSSNHSPSSPWLQVPVPNYQEDPLSPDHSKHSHVANNTPMKVEVMKREEAPSKLLCSTCQKEFKSLPALNGHMRSHVGFKTVPTPKMLLKIEKAAVRGATQATQAPRTSKKKYRHTLQPLVIPSPGVGLATVSAVLFQSRLRSPPAAGEEPAYTPPPMLSPVRRGSGLFNSVRAAATGGSVSPATPRVFLRRTGSVSANIVLTAVGSGEQSVDIEPRINIGPRFQAEIPDVQERSKVEKDIHLAGLLWTPWRELEDPATQQKVDDLVNVACSSVLPGGGTNTEFALHCLFECRGNFLATLEKLLMLKPLRHKANPLAGYHYAGSDKWTTLEKKQLTKALMIHNKDFFLVQKMVKTKTVAQCVEYYYTWKKRLCLGKRQKACLMDLEPETTDDWTKREADSENKPLEQGFRVLGSPDQADPAVLSNVSFVCEVPGCGAAFSSKQALSGHARIHSSPGSKHHMEKNRPKTAPQSIPGSLKSSPAHSTTSGETDPTLLFPCKECGKIFYKIKSRNAHMKTHRQQEDTQGWRSQKPPECTPPKSGPDSPSAAPVPVAVPQLPFDHMGLVKRLREEDVRAEEEDEDDEDDDEEEEEDCPLVAHPSAQRQLGAAAKSEEQ
ncbi:transcriptional-regulating factor 1 isoform X2 [Scleropages formosus]|uniref:Transcriptional regulating factor 1 n=1 Tax=Scleropages formosus TaxID=113540 RepID=A0A8C9RTH3_SCLFO|nr:transcriptional-regulating factor 1 isoform X2 [Scleropages formosus]